MPHWINTQKSVFSKKVDSHANMIDLNSLNQAQKMAYDNVEQHVQGSKLRLIQSPMRLTFSPWRLKLLV